MLYNRSMADFVPVAKISDVPAGKMKSFVTGGKQIAIANVDGKYFAIDDLCTHAQCSLGGEGVLEGKNVTCGCHGSTFDVTNGKVKSPPATKNESSYEVKVEGDSIFVRL